MSKITRTNIKKNGKADAADTNKKKGLNKDADKRAEREREREKERKDKSKVKGKRQCSKGSSFFPVIQVPWRIEKRLEGEKERTRIQHHYYCGRVEEREFNFKIPFL